MCVISEITSRLKEFMSYKETVTFILCDALEADR
jgi:hypothetical protein